MPTRVGWEPGNMAVPVILRMLAHAGQADGGTVQRDSRVTVVSDKEHVARGV